jgi:hypothetical protein
LSLGEVLAPVFLGSTKVIDDDESHQSMTHVPLVTRAAFVRTHRRSVSLGRRMGLRHGLIASRVRLLGPTVARGVRAGASVKRRAGASFRVAVSTGPIENEDQYGNDSDEHSDGNHCRSA